MGERDFVRCSLIPPHRALAKGTRCTRASPTPSRPELAAQRLDAYSLAWLSARDDLKPRTRALYAHPAEASLIYQHASADRDRAIATALSAAAAGGNVRPLPVRALRWPRMTSLRLLRGAR